MEPAIFVPSFYWTAHLLYKKYSALYGFVVSVFVNFPTSYKALESALCTTSKQKGAVAVAVVN